MSIDVADWLRGLGLGQYASVFAANDIDAEVLPELTADDLTGLGITSIGHRRKLLAGIAALRGGAPQPVTETAPSAAAAAASAEAERRVYSWFTEGFDTADLKEAKALLDQLA
jgi:hypothetical protein